MARFAVAVAGLVTLAICAAAPDTARAGAPDGIDLGFCLTGVQRFVDVQMEKQFVSVFDYCADAGGYGQLTIFIRPPAPPPPPPPPKPPKGPIA